MKHFKIKSQHLIVNTLHLCYVGKEKTKLFFIKLFKGEEAGKAYTLSKFP